jgi:diguanylate cyclase (GGDEF)-like protein
MLREFWRASFLLAALASEGHAAGTPFPMYFDRFDRDAGLSQLAVNTIAEDTAGFLWVGTEDGFDRFDGYTFQHAPRDAGDADRLPNGYVADIAIDTRGALWLATDGGGVIRRDPITGRFETLADLVGNSRATAGLERVRTVQFDSSGSLWIGSREAGVARFDPATRQLERFRHRAGAAGLSSDSIFALLQDRTGTLWAGTAAGLDRFDERHRDFANQRLPIPTDTLVRALLEDRAGTLWVATAAGLAQIEGRDRQTRLHRHKAADRSALPSDNITALLEDHSGRVWIGTAAGLALLDRAAGSFAVYRHDPADPKSLPDDNIVSLFEDRNGLLWIGTKFGGLAKWNPRTWSFGHHPARAEQGFASRNVMALTEDRKKRLWVATFDGGIAIVDRTTGSATTLRKRPGGLSDDRVMTLLTDRQGTIWAGTMGGGLNRVEPDTGRVTVFPHDPDDKQTVGAPGVMSLFEDSTGHLWAGTYGGGLSRLDRASGKFHRYITDPSDSTTLASDRVTALAEDSIGFLWVGTDGGGLHVLDPATGRFARLRHDPRNPKSLSADTVYAIHIDANDRVWVGTRGGGLNRVVGDARDPRSIRFVHLTEKNGLPNDTIYGIRSDAKGAIWVSTNYGLARVNPTTGKARSFHRSHGLQGEEFSFGAHYANARGELFFGGANGFNAFVPEQLQINQSPPAIVLTSLSFPNRAPLVGAAARGMQRLHLGYREDAVTFEFAALDFAAPYANTFQYWLEGSNRGWVNAGTRRTVTYSNLPGGDYTLHVRAANADGVWNTKGLSIALEVDPPPWRSTWAYAAYSLLVVMTCIGGWLVIRYRLQREARQREMLEKLVRERTHDLASHARALEVANRRLEVASFTDPLTGLGNRRSLKQTIPQLISGMPQGSQLALMVADLDCLKPINDEHGHEAGDRVLVHVSRILRDCLRAQDIVVRWGGDEFVIVHSCNDLEPAAELAERIRIAVSTHLYRLPGSSIARTSCSIGFAMYPFVRAAPGMLSWEEVLRLADAALYRAKTRRNAWVGWSGRKATPDLAARVIADPDSAELDNLIRSSSSAATSDETIELVLRRSVSRGRP